MNLEGIIKEWLELNKEYYDGLANAEIGCGCSSDDLMPCEYPDLRNCKAGHKLGDIIVVGPRGATIGQYEDE